MRVFLSYHSQFLELAKLLSAKGHEICTHPEFVKILNDIDVKSVNLSEQITDAGKVESMLYAVDVLRAIPHVLKIVPSYPALDDASKRFVSKEVDAFLYQRLSNLAMIVSAIDTAKPDIVVLHNDVDPMQRTVALWARANGVPCVHVPHAIYIEETDRGPIGSDVHDIVTASFLASSGTYQSNWYMNRGVKPNVIRETGIPSINKKVVQLHKGKASAALGLNPGLPTITYASSWRQDTNILGCHSGVDEWYEKILDVVRSFPPNSVQLIVKTHPNSPSLQWHIDMAKNKDVRCLVTATHLDAVLGASDLLISYGPSNIVIDASFHPGIRLSCTHGFEGNPEIHKFGEDATVESVVNDIKKLLSVLPVNYAEFRTLFARHNDGKNSERIAKFVEDVANDKN